MCWCYVAVWLWWCGIRMQAEALIPLILLLLYSVLSMFRMLIHPSSGACDIEPDTTHEVTQRISRKLLRMDVLTYETC